MSSFKCNAVDCSFHTFDVNVFLFHHGNHPSNEANLFVCNQSGCFKDLGSRKAFRDHIRKHSRSVNGVRPVSEIPNTSSGQENYCEIEFENNTEFYPELNVNLNEAMSVSNEITEDCTINLDMGLHAKFFDDDDSYKEMDEFLLELVLSLYGSKDLTIKLCIKVVEYLKKISEKTVELCIKRISNSTDIEEAKEALKQCPIIDFSNYSSEYKFEKKLLDMNLLQKPTKFTIANEVVERIPGELENIKHLGVLMDIQFQITKFLEIDGVLECILNYQSYLNTASFGVYKNFINGRSWKKIAAKYKDKTLIPLFIYNDDFQIDDKVGPHSSANSLSSFYYFFPTLPPYLASKLDFIFDAMTIKAADLKVYGNRSALHALLQAFVKLETEGVVLFEGSPKEVVVHVVMAKVLGDNLGLHCICGFRKSFNHNRPCMYCEIVLDDLKHTTNIDMNLMRTVDKYEEYFREEGKPYEYGVESYSVLNFFPSFHVIENNVVDLMHDVKLGYIQFFLQKALRYFISTYTNLSLEKLNERIQNFDYGHREQANKPGLILESHLKNKLHLNANEAIALLRLLPLILFNCVPYPDPVYQLLLRTIKTVEKCYAWEFTEETISELEILIAQNKREYMTQFDTVMRPKDHHMLHYKTVIKENGPLRGLSTIRLEGKHKVITNYTNNNKNRKLICYGVSKKLAYEFAYFLFKSKRCNILSHISNLSIIKNEEANEELRQFLFACQYDSNKFVEVKNVTYNGLKYKIGDFIIENENLAAKISKLYVSEINDIVVLCFELFSISYDENLYAYKIGDFCGNEIDLLTNFQNHPSSCHSVGGSIFIKTKM